jgi:hypothetical protein
MRLRFVPRRARGPVAAVVISTVAACCFAGPAMAGTSTITVANATATPEQAVPVDLTFSGTNGQAGSSEVQAVIRPAGGLPCQSSYQDDVSAVGGEDQVIAVPSVGPGAYQVTASYKPLTASSYQVCAWLEQQSVNGASQVVAGPSTVSFTARDPQVGQFTVAVPKALVPNQAFQISYATQTDQSLDLYSVIKAVPSAPAGGGASAQPCPASFEFQQGLGQVETILFGFGQQTVFGGPTTTTATAKEKTGTYAICTWLEGPGSGEVDDLADTPVTVGTPVTQPPQPGLKFTWASASRRHGLAVAGRTASAFSGRLTLAAACGSSTSKRTTTAKKGRFSATMGLPKSCRSRKTVKVTVSWAGSSSYAKQSITRSVAIGK